MDRIDRLEEVTYIISETSDFPDYYRALDLMIHVVKPAWVTASLKVNKTKNPRTYSPDPALFMSDVVICCGDIPSGDKEAIEGGVLAMGGQITLALTKQVTHLIALDLSEERCQLAISKRLQLTIVLPHWYLHVLRRFTHEILTQPGSTTASRSAVAFLSARIRYLTQRSSMSWTLPQFPLHERASRYAMPRVPTR